MRPHPIPYSRQQGVALITAILLVAIATLIAAKLSWDNQISIRRTETTLMLEQARLFALGGEAVAIEYLLEDDNNYDYKNDDYDWTLPIGPIEIGIEATVLGQMQGRLDDAQGRLNINNLVPDTANGDVYAQFERLFNTLDIDTSIIDAIIDWIDTDTVPLNRGAEDGTYTALDPGYRPANNYFTRISELRAVKGIDALDAETYNELLRHITALHPDWCGATPTPVNMNFATAEVMTALDPGISLGQAEAWVEQRPGWQDISEIGVPADTAAYVSVQTACLHLTVVVNVGSLVVSMYSLLDRSGNDIVTRVRAYGLD